MEHFFEIPKNGLDKLEPNPTFSNGVIVTNYGYEFLDPTVVPDMSTQVVKDGIIITDYDSAAGEHIRKDWFRYNLPMSELFLQEDGRMNPLLLNEIHAGEQYKTVKDICHFRVTKPLRRLRRRCEGGVAFMFERCSHFTPDVDEAVTFYHTIWFELEEDAIQSTVHVITDKMVLLHDYINTLEEQLVYAR